MKRRRHHTALLLLALATTLPLGAQTTGYAVASTCGCDIFFVDGIQTTREGDLYGFRRYDGTVLTPNIYRYVGQFTNGYCMVWMEDTTAEATNASEPPLLCGLIDSTGRQVVPCLYHAVGIPNEGRISVKRDSLFGYTDLSGRMVIPLQFRDAGIFSCGRAPVAVVVDSFFLFYTYIDTLGRQVFPPHYQQTLPYIDGYAPAKLYDRWGVIDLEGNEIVPFAFESLTAPDHRIVFAGDQEDMAAFLLPKHSPRRQIAPASPFIYIPLSNASDNRIAVYRDGKHGFLDLEGNEVIPCVYDEVGTFRRGRAMVRQGDRYGIIDTLGDTILPIEYEDKSIKGHKYVYYNDLALVEQNGRLGFVDLQGRLVVPLILDQAYHFSQNLAPVNKDGYWGYIDIHGDLYLPLIFDFASPFQHNRADVVFNGQSLKIDPTGRCVQNCHGIISFRRLPEMNDDTSE